jgi:RNA-directed DNA polymerase
MRREPPVRIREGLGVKLPRATRLVICCRGTAAEAMTVMRDMMSELKLTVNETKTRTCRVPEETFDFLGHTFGRNYDPRTGEAYLGAKPSGKKIKRLCREISETTGRRRTLIPVEKQVAQINQKLRGWINYFRVGTVSRAYDVVNNHVTYRLRRWLCAKHKVRGPGYSRFPDRYLYRTLGLFKLQRAAPDPP